jgi:hypothetical protein
MDAHTVDQLCSELCGKAGYVGVPQREPICARSLSTVERLRFLDGTTAIFKFAAEPFTWEDRALELASIHGAPVPSLYASAVRDETLGILMEDLGEPLRMASHEDGVRAVAALHRIRPSDIPPVTLGTEELRSLPARALAHLDYLRQVRRWKSSLDIAEMLAALHKVAPSRAQGAELAPFGLCHSEFDPGSVHVGHAEFKLLDLASMVNGPGLLDLASWPGLQWPANKTRVRMLINSYVAGGGHHDALTPRAGLPAEVWALGWHRVWAVERFMNQAVHCGDDRTSDPASMRAVRRHLREALRLLAT